MATQAQTNSTAFNIIQLEGMSVTPGSTTVTATLINPAGNVTRAFGATVPTDGEAGYGTGCYFIKSTGGIGGTAYVNSGSSASCAFRPISDGMSGQFVVTALGATQNSTPTAAQLLGGLVTQQSQTAGGTVTFPTGTQLSAAFPGVVVGSAFTTTFANIGNQTLTFTGATGSTVVGTAALATLKNARLTFVNTGSNAWNVYTMISA